MASITVLMAVYNGMPYLPEAVESIRNQTISDWEFLIVNDGSTDGSKSYLDAVDDDRIRVIHQSNQGLAASLNNGLKHCNTEFVARLDSDDICTPDRLERQLSHMRLHPELGMLGSQIVRLGTRASGFQSKLPCHHDSIVHALLNGKHAMCHPTIMCRTEVLKKIGGYWQHPIAQDWDVYLKVSEHAKIANLDECLLKYRIHSGSLNGQKLAAIRSHQRYAADCAHCRGDGRPPLDFSAFQELEKQRSLIWRMNEKKNVFAMTQYRIALTNILGGQRLLGYLRLAFAAGCSPKLTSQRIARIFKHRLNSSGKALHKPAASVAGTQGNS